ncbi:hypothetical protein [Opitutus terrae]|uniref:Uncharacterized protein n=1 Tax=Opitutus terrae (strain DSM 11246 / JCM 15787 / PB90-1) TaxID=452637 RepID=B1ZV56_OPITP|nr:hypothetical protein [Opitutus terrae]ACB76723.1 hypothetical protein Oter_3446 [Opitutus terrae PB90-1]
MARIQLNSALKAIQGGIDNWIYRLRGGRVIIGPRVAPADPQSAAQVQARNRFKLAAAYARSTTPDAVYEQAARENGWTPFIVMMADYLRPPEVDLINLSGYHGAIGDPITVGARDDVSVTAVNVAIRNADLSVLEEGAATLVNGMWVYTATTARTSGQTVSIAATAVDRPGHTGTLSETWTMP